MSSAGQANEAGSVARCNAATYFGIYLLAGMPIEALENYRTIAHVGFESSDPTDDIVLTFEGGTRAFVSSKRKVTYGPPFTDTVNAWVAQLDEEPGDEDLLVLVCEEAAEWVRDLADALTKLRAGVAADSKRHLVALSRLNAQVPVEKQAEIRRRARIIELPRTATNNDGRTVLALMMNSLVEGNAGAGAVSAVLDKTHEWAGGGLGFDAEKLVAVLAERDIVVRADENGPAAARAAAARTAVAEYLDALSALNGRIDLTLLAQDLEPIVVENLLANVEVSRPSKERGSGGELRIVLRRNRRVLIVGQPGSGKSLAMRELAGWTAIDPDAPIPVPVHLPELLPRHVDDAVRIEDLVRLAAKRGPKSGIDQVERFLIRAVEEGDAILLLDGLDECRDRAAWMAERLRALVADLHPLTGVVVASRGSTEVPAERIGLSRVDIGRPGNLDATIDAVLVQCAEVRVHEPDQRTEWLQVRRAWLADARDNQSGILQVPQLALLVTLIIGSTADLEVPKKRAELLHEAVRESVKRWEHDRFSGSLTGTWAHDLTPQMLIDGFVALGRLMEDRVSPPSRTDALATLSDMLVDSERWNLPGARARELADQVLTFWDTHVAVFVLDEEDRLTSRSRVFTEVATAMWTMTCSAEALRQWGTEAIRFYDSDGVVALALGLNPAVVDLLLEIGESMTEATLALAASAAAGAIDLSPAQVALLTAQLGRHASEVERGTKELPERQTRDEQSFLMELIGGRHYGPASWPLVEALCALDLDQEQRRERDDLLSRVALKPPHSFTALAWIALADAAADARPLADAELEIVVDVLGRELPPTESMVKVDGVHTFAGFGHLDAGLGDVAQRAVQFLAQLPEGVPEQIYRISDHTDHKDAEDIRIALTQAGVDTSQWAAPSRFAGYFNSLRERDYETRMLEDVSSIGDTSTPLDKRDCWSLPHVSNLIEATGYARASVSAFSAAFVSDNAELRRTWLRALGHAYDIDLNRAAAEAAVALEEPLDDFANPPSWRLVSSGQFDRIELPDQRSLSAANQQALLEAMHANSHWIAHASLYILANAVPTWDTVEFFNFDRSTWPPYRASECYFLSLLVSPESPRLAEQAIASVEPARRHALARSIMFRRELDSTGAFAARLGADEDMWVRERHDAGELAATCWTCRWCGQRNDPSKGSCSSCELASRPESRQDDRTD